MRRTRVRDANIVIPRRSPRIIDQVQRRDEHATEASRKRKGKSIAPYQKRRQANSYVPRRNTSRVIVIGSTDGENNNHDSTDNSSTDDGEHYEIDTSDDDVTADDDN